MAANAPSSDAFVTALQAGYGFTEPALDLGVALRDGTPHPGVPIRLPLRMFNRHGLIAGATGTGKTKSLQVLAEQLSLAGIPSLAMDLKGDLSGLAAPGAESPGLRKRLDTIRLPWEPRAFPVEFLTLSGEPGVRLRAGVSEFGPLLFSKMLGLNETQAGAAAVLFQYCDDHGLPLVNLPDVRTALNFLTGDGKAEAESRYGRLSTATVGTVLRKLLELEQQGAAVFFGQPSFEVSDLLRLDAQGRGVVSILRLTDLQSRPKLFSTFMLALLAELFATLPEAGDLEKPKLVVFIDEAHLLFSEATPAVLDQIELTVKLIRSKGVGLFFCTQNPQDIPAGVLGQLGTRLQHALRAFTAQDRKAIRLASQNYPDSPFYKIDELLTALGIGEALVTGLGPAGAPTPPVACLLRPPESRMAVLAPAELATAVARSSLVSHYARELDPESAHEILTRKLAATRTQKQWEDMLKEQARRRPPAIPVPAPSRPAPSSLPPRRTEASPLEKILNSPTARQVGRTMAREVTRSILGVLGFGGRRR